MEPEICTPTSLPASLRLRCSSMLVPGQWHHLTVVMAKDVKKSCLTSAYFNGKLFGTGKVRLKPPVVKSSNLFWQNSNRCVSAVRWDTSSHSLVSTSRWNPQLWLTSLVWSERHFSGRSVRLWCGEWGHVTCLKRLWVLRLWDSFTHKAPLT